MSRFNSYVLSAAKILEGYHGDEPFAHALKRYFAANPKFGSRDRKAIGHLCYCFFRLGKAVTQLPAEERMLVGLFCCSPAPGGLLAHLHPEWDAQASLPLAEKMQLSGAIKKEEVFPFADRVSSTLHLDAFIGSFFAQPDLFIRVRPGYMAHVQAALHQEGIIFQQAGNCIALPNGTRIENILAVNREIVIQDASSQNTGQLVARAVELAGKKIWDCCAASGGKSLMTYDLHPGIQLTVSDIRESILVNLKKRFREAGIQRYHSLSWDLARKPLSSTETFDVIIADVPCSGSGTWARTPEQLFYFDTAAIDTYAALQYAIVSNALQSLRPGGVLLYITCSVFKGENEAMVDEIKEKFNLQPLKMEVLKGYDKKADTLFAALLTC